jgi:hypothetical protein
MSKHAKTKTAPPLAPSLAAAEDAHAAQAQTADADARFWASIAAADNATAAKAAAEAKAAEHKAAKGPSKSRGPTLLDNAKRILAHKGVLNRTALIAALRVLHPEVGKGASGIAATAAGEAAARKAREAGADLEAQAAADAQARHDYQAQASIGAQLSTLAKAGKLTSDGKGTYSLPAQTAAA